MIALRTYLCDLLFRLLIVFHFEVVNNDRKYQFLSDYGCRILTLMDYCVKRCVECVRKSEISEVAFLSHGDLKKGKFYPQRSIESLLVRYSCVVHNVGELHHCQM